jgi:alanyl-tRNA synthetase
MSGDRERTTSRRLDYDDAYTTRFQGRVATRADHGGRPAIELEATYFFPEGGGQEADRGRIGAAAVVDVQTDGEGRVWHVVEDAQALEALGDVDAEIDWRRRFDHMQQHTGQHILSAAFEHVLGAATLSSHLGVERSSIEVALAAVDWAAVDRLEEAANGVVWEDRPIQRHWVDDEGVKRFALRKPPKASGRIRIVEIPGWDVSACGGTHTLRTGEVGVVKIVRWEKVRGNLRFEFLCGRRALSDYAWRTETLLEASRRRTLKDRELIEHLERAAAERDDLAKRLEALTSELIVREARERTGDPPRGVEAFWETRPRDQLRTFAIKCLEVGSPWVVAGAAAPDPVVIVGRAKAGSVDLRALLPELLRRSAGKGGGGSDLVQITAADGETARATWTWASAAVPAALV